MLVCATHWLYLHLYTLAYMSMYESCLLVCRPYFNTMKLWTSNPNLHLSLADTTFCLLSCLFSFLLVCLLSCLLHSHLFARVFVSMLAMSVMFICTMPSHILFASFPSIACLLASSLCLCMYTHGVKMHRARARFPRHK